MGRSNKKYKRTLKEQVYDRLSEMLKAGEGQSKREAKAKGMTDGKIFSFSTYHTYRKHCNYFVNYITQKHPDCTTLKAAKKYIREWLDYRVNSVNANGNPLSAWTIYTERQALSKLYGIKPDDSSFFAAPQRRRVDIRRSRGVVANDKHFSEKNNYDLVQFCKGTGCRRNVLEKLKGGDLFTREEMIKELKYSSDQQQKELIKEALNTFPDKEFYLFHQRDKGGKSRFAPIIGKDVNAIVQRFRNTGPDASVWQHVSKNADIHSYRSDYATALYKEYARPIDKIPYDGFNSGIGRKYQKDVYVCRNDESGKRLDKKAMLIASKALGHNRIEVIASNYLRGL